MSEISKGQFNRRQLLAATGMAGASVLVGGVDSALAHEDPPNDVVVAKVEGHSGDAGLKLSRIDNGEAISVATSPTTDIPSESGSRRSAKAIPTGETVVIVAPGAGLAGTAGVVNAERVVHCNLGKFSDVKR